MKRAKAAACSPKLSPKQQEVVNLMAAGWKLERWRGWGMNSKYRSQLTKDGEARSVASNVPGDLKSKGVITYHVTGDFRSTTYSLTEAGRELSQPVKEPVAKTWWYAEQYGHDIGSLQFVTATEHTLVDARGSKTPKESNWRTFFDTREKAVECCIRRLQNGIAKAKTALAEAENDLAEFKRKERLS